MFTADIAVAEKPCFLYGIFKNFFCPGSERNVAKGERVPAGREIPFHLRTELVDIDPDLAKNGNGDAVFFTKRSEQNVLRSEIVVLKTLCFFTCVDDHFSSAFCELFEHHKRVPPSRKDSILTA